MSELLLKFVGCGDAFGSGGQINTCFFVKSSKTTFLIDCGGTSLPALKGHGIDIKLIDTIVISHFHGDHYGGLPFLLLDLAINGQSRELTIVSPEGCKERLLKLTGLLYPGIPVIDRLKINFMEYAAHQPLTVNNLVIEAFPVIHAAGSLPHGIRIGTANRTIGFSGDTEWTDELIAIADGADVFICECNFYNTHVSGHLSYNEVILHLPELKCKQLILTHPGPEMLDNRAGAKLKFAYEGLEIVL